MTSTTTPASGIEEILDCATHWIADDVPKPGLIPDEWQPAFALMRDAPGLLDSLNDVTRICEALRYTAGLGKNQLERIAKAKALIAKHSGGKS